MVWCKHELPMTRQDFVDEAAKSSTGTAGAAGIWPECQ